MKHICIARCFVWKKGGCILLWSHLQGFVRVLCATATGFGFAQHMVSSGRGDVPRRIGNFQERHTRGRSPVGKPAKNFSLRNSFLTEAKKTVPSPHIRIPPLHLSYLLGLLLCDAICTTLTLHFCVFLCSLFLSFVAASVAHMETHRMKQVSPAGCTCNIKSPLELPQRWKRVL